MIVLDASAAVELVLNLPLARHVLDRVERADWQIHAPQLLSIEILQVLRRRVAAGTTTVDQAEEARSIFADLGIVLHDLPMLADRVWQLRDNVSAYDAAYVTLAEVLEASLVTADARLARAPGHRATTDLVEP